MQPTIILTRPHSQNDAFRKAIGNCDVRFVISPLQQIVPVTTQFDPASVQAVIFTSANGVEQAKTLAFGKSIRAWCVGEKTAAVARKVGFDAVVGPGNADGLVEMIVDQKNQCTMAHLRGRHARGDICVRLSKHGITCHDIVIYDQQPLPLSDEAKTALVGRGPVVVPLFSPRSALLFKQEAPLHTDIKFIVMSQAVADVLISESNVTIADVPTLDAMVAATRTCLRSLSVDD